MPKPTTRLQALIQLLTDLERRGYFGDVVLKFKGGQLQSHSDLREVVDLDKAADR